MKIVIKGELPDLNTDISIIRSNKFAYSGHKAKWTGYVQLQALKQRKSFFIERYPVKLKFTWYSPTKRKDIDNIAFAKKYILDGMALAGVIEGDGQKYISGFGGEEFLVDKDDPRVEIEVL